ncbi:FAD-binding oxidoreductase [Sagittula sp. SSi028]|uniref:FAD-binding oxidoreductase n=1 Tax=Sagittula sp. SSi028 TaxID=3400636 RepID=UPI003AF792B8
MTYDQPPALHPADAAFADSLSAQLPQDTIRKTEPRHIEEPRGRWQGSSQFIALPRNTADVATILRACHDARVGVVPLGGGTGLVGGQIAPDGAPLLLSLERMTAIRDIRPSENAMTVEAGAILVDVQEAAQDVQRLFPLSLASQGSARIGGLLSTNAGGINTLRYGNARDLVLGLEAVLPDGQIWHGLKRLRKDNTGYDLRHLLIGAEGTLGVITAASLKLFARPAATGTAFLATPSPTSALQLLGLARDMLGDSVSAFELIHRQGFDFLSETLPDIRQPWDTPPEWSILIELGTGPAIDPARALEDLFAAALEQGLSDDGVIAQSAQQSQAFWDVREHIPEANRRIGAVSSHDISLPLDEIAGFIPQAKAALAKIGDFRINCFGHLGDGNLHFNVFPQRGGRREDHAHLREAIKTCVHDITHALGGSVSAEHGVGRLKTGDLERYGDRAKLSAMRAIKGALDPHGIMNPGAVIPR